MSIGSTLEAIKLTDPQSADKDSGKSEKEDKGEEKSEKSE